MLLPPSAFCLWAYAFFEKLQRRNFVSPQIVAAPNSDETRSLVDHTIVLCGSSPGNASSHDNMLIIVAGDGFRHGQHLAFNPLKNPPLCNLYVQLLCKLGATGD